MTIGYNDPGWGRRNPIECERGIPEFGFEELSDEARQVPDKRSW